jgi:hypothetical protein
VVRRRGRSVPGCAAPGQHWRPHGQPATQPHEYVRGGTSKILTLFHPATGQGDWLVNYAERYWAGLRVGTAITEGTANFLVNRRMNKSQQMRWSRRGADLLLQVRCAVYNGTFASGFGQRFSPTNDPLPQAAVAA